MRERISSTPREHPPSQPRFPCSSVTEPWRQSGGVLSARAFAARLAIGARSFRQSTSSRCIQTRRPETSAERSRHVLRRAHHRKLRRRPPPHTQRSGQSQAVFQKCRRWRACCGVVGRFTAFRFTVDPSPSQVVVLARHAGASRFAFNQCLALVKEALDAKRRDGSVVVPWSGFDLINAFNSWKTSAQAGRRFVVDRSRSTEMVATGLSWRTQVCQQVCEEAAVDLGRGLSAWTDSRGGKRPGRRVGFPTFKRKSRSRASFRIRCTTKAGRASIRVGDPTAGPRSVCLPKIGILRVREDTRRLRRMIRTGRAGIRYATVSCRAGRWTVTVTVEAADLHPAHRHPPRPDADGGGWVGVDRGLAALVVAADTTGRQVLRVDDPPRPLRTALPRLRRLSRQVSRRQPGSRNRAEAAARLGRAHLRVANVRRHFLHTVANRLVKTHDRLALEDLHTAGLLRNRRLAAAISDAGWADLARIIGYKQRWRGGQATPAPRWYPSTRMCSACRTTGPALPLSVRIFGCDECGHTADRDVNAAVNLAVWAEQHDVQTRDPEARGPVTNAPREAGSGQRPRAGETSLDDGGTPPPRTPVTAGTPEKGGVS
ncbi:RNA-guided endonuclease InsQ/TnpB family protein [Micromonospora sp. GCM10011541]|uniref:RNA-guided endonuclease InsQ/TnpB family protein n=1 Tax=Micromonospora sp. GCM10011541 TaxID=3317336 RepID=UPI00360CA13E